MTSGEKRREKEETKYAGNRTDVWWWFFFKIGPPQKIDIMLSDTMSNIH